MNSAIGRCAEPCDYRRFPVGRMPRAGSLAWHGASMDTGCHFATGCVILVNAMIHTKLTHLALPLSLAGLLLVAGCNKNQPPQNAEQPSASQPAASPTTPAPGTAASAPNATPAAPANTPPPPPPPPPQPVTYTIPAGNTHAQPSGLGQTIASNTAHAGDAFDATVTSPIVVKGRTLVTTGSTASGTVTAANSRGKFKGAGVLSLQLASSADRRKPDSRSDSSIWSRTLKRQGQAHCRLHRRAAAAPVRSSAAWPGAARVRSSADWLAPVQRTAAGAIHRKPAGRCQR